VSVRVVVADTDPLHGLVLINQIDRLFAAVTVPTVVRDELLHPHTPRPVRDWATDPPPWLTVATDPSPPPSPQSRFGCRA
jgi:hypothetical protein